ncbi:hypothetical protein [Haloarchaeobius amylolyticus]|uniref:hypothetical protein n=1 Tax=Haloarchaeobius amylolyticus TaxID=1198296 RepID=UPI00226DA8FC|nr:hypothetical protein [Haloarchaeobius amylolyticus]
MIPLQVPGGPEILVMLLVLAIPLAIVAAVVVLLRNRSGRVEELETRVAELEAELRRNEQSR